MLQTCIATRAARLALRPVREGDDEALFPLFADWDVIRWLSSPPWPYTREDMQSFIREQTAPDGEDAETRFAITLQQAPIGILSVRMRPASVPIPKFASLRGTLVCELRNQRDTRNL